MNYQENMFKIVIINMILIKDMLLYLKKEINIYIDMYSDSFITGNKKIKTSSLTMEGTIKKINFNEKLPLGSGWHGKDFYTINFENIKILKSENNNFKFNPNIYILT